MGAQESKPMPGGYASSYEDPQTHDSDTKSTRSNIYEAPAEVLPKSFDIDDYSEFEYIGEVSTYAPSPQKLQASGTSARGLDNMAPISSRPTRVPTSLQYESSKGSKKTFTTTQMKDWTNDILRLTNLGQVEKVLDILKRLSDGRMTREGMLESGIAHVVSRLSCVIPELVLPAENLSAAWLADPNLGPLDQNVAQTFDGSGLDGFGEKKPMDRSAALSIKEVAVFQLCLDVYTRKPEAHDSAMWSLQQLRDRPISADILNFTGIHFTVYDLLINPRPKYRVSAVLTLGKWRRARLLPDNFDALHVPTALFGVPSMPESGKPALQGASFIPPSNGSPIQALPVAPSGPTDLAAYININLPECKSAGMRAETTQRPSVWTPAALSMPNERLPNTTGPGTNAINAIPQPVLMMRHTRQVLEQADLPMLNSPATQHSLAAKVQEAAGDVPSIAAPK
jgi:hypothetical protein